MTDHRLPVRWETKRLILRCYQQSDAGWYYAMSVRNRAHLQCYESGNVILSVASERHARETLCELGSCWQEGIFYFIGAFDKSSHEFVAQVYVGPFRASPVDYIIGYIADCQHEGKGYVSEAVASTVARVFSDLKADQVRIHCDEDNVRSRKVAERCGFCLERIFPEEKTGSNGQLGACNTAVYIKFPSNGSADYNAKGEN